MRYLSIAIVVLVLSCTQKQELTEMSFPDTTDQTISLQTIKDAELTAFYFLAPECPISQNYTKNINELSEEINSISVFSGTIYSVQEVKNFIKEYDLATTNLIDKDYQLATHFGATVTPEVFLVDKQGTVLYSGKIDNWAEALGVKRQVVTKFYLKEAIAQYRSGEEIKIKRTEPVGCVLE